jgi:hypothetical protein
MVIVCICIGCMIGRQAINKGVTKDLQKIHVMDPFWLT